jgi:Polysulphide reductase, NrfD
MSEAEATKEGLRNQRPGRDAKVGSAGGRTQRRGRRDDAMVDPAKFESYYGKPVLNRPVWKARYIASYFFLGGLAGASSVLEAGSHLRGLDRLARAYRLGATVAVAGSLYGLIADLGRPSRFVYMLRMAKPTSPMSVGSWLLAGYAPAVVATAISRETGILPLVGGAASFTAAGMGPAVASYTSALAADTAVPAWHEAWPELPFVFTGSAATAAAGVGLIAAPVAENGPARWAAAAGAALDLGASQRMEHRLGELAEPYHEGRSGQMMKAAKAATAAGALGSLTLARRSRIGAVVSGALLLAGSALTKFGIFEAGMASADDPKFTVKPQRERLDASGSA